MAVPYHSEMRQGTIKGFGPQKLNTDQLNFNLMCESTVFIDDGSEVREVMQDVTRIVMEGRNAVITNIIGERMVLENVELKEANLLSHGLVFKRI